MHVKRRLLLVTAASAVLPGAAAPQTGQVGAFVGSAPASAGAGSLVGVSAGLGTGPLALRFSAAIDAAGTPVAPVVAAADSEDSGDWAADADLQLRTGRVGGLLRPAAFGGVGLRGVSYRPAFDAEVATEVVPVFSYGARMELPVTSWFSLEGEARRRTAMAQEWRGQVDGWEYRAGLTFTFGGAAPRASGRGRAPGRGRAVYGGARRDASAAEIADGAIRTGERYLGTRYAWGGQSPRSGFDCSGFVQYVYRENGVHLPRVSRQQAYAGDPLPLSLGALARGDLMFFAGDDGRIDHVAIYAGNGMILHSTSSGGGVRYDDLSGSRGRWFSDHFVAARRVIRADRSAPLRELPLDEAFDAVTGFDRGDDAPPVDPAGT